MKKDKFLQLVDDYITAKQELEKKKDSFRLHFDHVKAGFIIASLDDNKLSVKEIMDLVNLDK